MMSSRRGGMSFLLRELLLLLHMLKRHQAFKNTFVIEGIVFVAVVIVSDVALKCLTSRFGQFGGPI